MQKRAGMVLAMSLGLFLSGCQTAARSVPSVTSRPVEKLALLVWDKDRPLTWQDFQSEVPEDKSREGFAGRLAANFGLAHRTYEAAETASVISKSTYSYTYNCTSNPGAPTRCRLSTADLQSIHAAFDPNLSWAITEDETPDLLRHEQGHFDIAALYAAKLQNELRAALTSRAGALEREGPDNSAAETALTAEVDATAVRVRDELMRQFSAEQARYDGETKHGTDSAAQRRWTAQLDAGLRA